MILFKKQVFDFLDSFCIYF